MIDHSDIESTIQQCFAEMQAASRTKYDGEMADRTAALFLVAQMKLSVLIEEVEMRAKNSKNEIIRIEGEKYFEYKNNNIDKKITENMMANYIAKEPDISHAREECATCEANLKKWNYLFGVLKDGHIFFRNLSKTKTWAE